MTKYINLTRKFIDENGQETVRCAFYATGKCLHPDTYNCFQCEMMQHMLNHLHAFEQIYTQEAL